MARLIATCILFSAILLCRGEYNEDDFKSILNYPRLHFSGKYIVNAATINNIFENYNSEAFVEHHALPTKEGGKGGWNPRGSNDFLLKDVTIKRACYLDGVCSENQQQDFAIGKSIQDIGFHSPSKIVDLDPNAQQFTQIWSLEIKIPDLLQAKVDVLTLRRYWQNAIHSNPKNDSSLSGTMHGVLAEPVWGANETSSRIIQQLKSEMKRLGSDHLSLRFVLGTFITHKMEGRIYGSIGVLGSKSPKEFILERVLVSQHQKLYQDSPFKIDKNLGRIVFEMGGSLPTDANGKLIDNNNEYLVIAYPEETASEIANVTCGTKFTFLGKVPTQRAGWLENEAGIFSIELSRRTVVLLENRPVVLLKVRGEKSNVTCLDVAMKECNDGIHVRPMGKFLFREDSGEHISVKLGAKKFGKQHANLEIGFFLTKNSTKLHCCWPEFPLPGDLITDINGVVEANITLPMLHNPRKFIDGQIYGIAYYPKRTCLESSIRRKAGDYIIAVKVYNYHEYPEEVTWTEHVYPIFKQYANLYPIMKRPSLDLSDYRSVVKMKNIVSLSFKLPMSHSSYMPVQRDLSVRKRRMITKWLDDKTPRFGDVNKMISVQLLRGLLQTALEVEHATLPPYLTALWSIRDGYNRQVHRLIKTVIRQEMLHMGLVANLLNAVGGSPSLIHSTFIPNYPTHLPGGLQPNLIVSLEKLSPGVIRDVFMQIEKADNNKYDQAFRTAIFSQIKVHILRQFCSNKSSNVQCQRFLRSEAYNVYSPAKGCPKTVRDFLKTSPGKHGSESNNGHNILDQINFKTGIAAFYTHVLYVIAKLTNCGADNSIFTGDPNRQLTTDAYHYGNGKLFKVTDYVSAMKAVMTIIEEGEGTSDCDPAVHYFQASDDLSHYSMFHTIVKQRKIKIRKKVAKNMEGFFNSTLQECDMNDKPYDFSGTAVPYIASATWPILKNAKETDYLPASLARIQSRIFARLYNRLLASLHKSFNGEKEFFINAKFLMYAVDYYGRRLVQTPIYKTISRFVGPNAAPIFKWIKTEVKNLRATKYATDHISALNVAKKPTAKGRTTTTAKKGKTKTTTTGGKITRKPARTKKREYRKKPYRIRLKYKGKKRRKIHRYRNGHNSYRYLKELEVLLGRRRPWELYAINGEWQRRRRQSYPDMSEDRNENYYGKDFDNEEREYEPGDDEPRINTRYEEPRTDSRYEEPRTDSHYEEPRTDSQYEEPRIDSRYEDEDEDDFNRRSNRADQEENSYENGD